MVQVAQSGLQGFGAQEHERLILAFPEPFLNLSPLEQRIALCVYRLLADGWPVPTTRLGAEAGINPDMLTAALGGWPGVYADDRGRIIGFWGLALAPMNHRFEIDGRVLYTWCAWDSLFLPALLGASARVTSHCELSGETIRLMVSPDGVGEVEPQSTVMSFLEPQQEKISADVVGNFCHYVHFFASSKTGEQWIAEHPGTFLLTLDEAFLLGSCKNRLQFPSLFSHKQQSE